MPGLAQAQVALAEYCLCICNYVMSSLWIPSFNTPSSFPSVSGVCGVASPCVSRPHAILVISSASASSLSQRECLGSLREGGTGAQGTLVWVFDRGAHTFPGVAVTCDQILYWPWRSTIFSPVATIAKLMFYITHLGGALLTCPTTPLLKRHLLLISSNDTKF